MAPGCDRNHINVCDLLPLRTRELVMIDPTFAGHAPMEPGQPAFVISIPGAVFMPKFCWRVAATLICSCVILFFLAVGSAYATSVVVHVDDKHITIAADDLATRMFTSNSGPYAACKIVPLGQAAFAVAGNIDYKKNDPSDTLEDWDARADARTAFLHHVGDLRATAAEWATRAAVHYSLFLLAQPARVRELAAANRQHVLVLETFAGWDRRNEAVVMFEWIYLDLSSTSAIKSRSFVLPARTLPYTTNATTQDLIEGNSVRSTQVLTDWQLASETFPSPERGWRWLEFLIQSTSDYDHTVGREVNVLDLTPHENANWLQNCSCRKP
jgi:hypothetical protein